MRLLSGCANPCAHSWFGNLYSFIYECGAACGVVRHRMMTSADLLMWYSSCTGVGAHVLFSQDFRAKAERMFLKNVSFCFCLL